MEKQIGCEELHNLCSSPCKRDEMGQVPRTHGEHDKCILNFSVEPDRRIFWKLGNSYVDNKTCIVNKDEWREKDREFLD
jgi:hypothetical protein